MVRRIRRKSAKHPTLTSVAEPLLAERVYAVPSAAIDKTYFA
jgi:hypothetical protein